MAQQAPSVPLGTRGVNDPGRKVEPRANDIILRSTQWDNLAYHAAGARSEDEWVHIVRCWTATASNGSEVIDQWDWLLGSAPEVQGHIFKWRQKWWKAWRDPVVGIGKDTALLPAAWKRIAYILDGGTYPIADLAPRCAAILNNDAKIWGDDEVWTNLSQPGKQEPINGTGCTVVREYALNKLSRLRTPRARKLQLPSWASPPIDTVDTFRLLPSRQSEDPPAYTEPLWTPFAQTSRGKFTSSRISKTSTIRRKAFYRV